MQAPRDQNRVPVVLGVSSVDFVTPIPWQVDSVTGYLLIQVADSSVQSPVTNTAIASRDENRITTRIGVSEDDSVTPVNIVIVPTSPTVAHGYLRIKEV